mmetsp:Transcript_16561/g.39299  ORF Transcript_16561/g.39299 Transcript_16561/m.39299 type:complete len:218 (+) Transcript_16561:261-914(+)
MHKCPQERLLIRAPVARKELLDGGLPSALACACDPCPGNEEVGVGDDEATAPVDPRHTAPARLLDIGQQVERVARRNRSVRPVVREVHLDLSALELVPEPHGLPRVRLVPCLEHHVADFLARAGEVCPQASLAGERLFSRAGAANAGDAPGRAVGCGGALRERRRKRLPAASSALALGSALRCAGRPLVASALWPVSSEEIAGANAGRGALGHEIRA